MGYPDEDQQRIVNLYNCKLGLFPTSYLGIPISDARVHVKDLHPIVSRVQHRVEPWHGRFLSKAPMTVLINSSLSILVMYVMSFYNLHYTLHHDMEKYQSMFF